MFQTLASNPSLHFSPLSSSPSPPHSPSAAPFPSSFSSPSLTSSSRSSRLSLRCQATATDTSTRSSNHHHHIRSPASLYDILRVNRTASMTEIKTAYRTLAKLYHPDAAPSSGGGGVDEDHHHQTRRGSDGLDFIAIHNAYETLSDPAARALYDLSLGFGARDNGGGVRLSYSAWADDRRRSRFHTTRRWETDQCW